MRTQQNTCIQNARDLYIVDFETQRVRRVRMVMSQKPWFLFYEYWPGGQTRQLTYFNTQHHSTKSHYHQKIQFDIQGQVTSYEDSWGNYWQPHWGAQMVYTQQVDELIALARAVSEHVRGFTQPLYPFLFKEV